MKESAGGAKPCLSAKFHLLKFFFLDLRIKFGRMIEKEYNTQDNIEALLKNPDIPESIKKVFK